MLGRAEGGRATGRRARLALVGACLTALGACSGTPVPPQAAGANRVLAGNAGHSPQSNAVPTWQPGAPGTPPAATLATGAPRRSGGVVAAGLNAPYNYAPTVLHTGGKYRMWWCSQLPGVARPGDQILYAESDSPDGPFAGPSGAPADAVFGNTPGGFDALHTCDPSVIEVAGTYYLYYTGTADPAGNGNAIGLATSPDGVHWTRANNGAPIVPASGEVARANAYGVGQPSALHLGNWFYLMFTDTTGAMAGPSGNGQFVLRSADPAFAGGVQALTPTGFVPVPGTKAQRLRPVLAGFTADWMWVDALDAFALAMDTADGTSITFWDADFRYQPYKPLMIGGPQQEGPGLVRRADGHAPVSTQDPCGRVPLDVVRATAPGAGPTGLMHFGVDVTGLSACRNAARAANLLEGFAVPSPDRTVELVVGGKLVEVERRSVAAALAVDVLASAPPALAGLPVVARLPAGADAVTAPGRPLGFVLDGGRLWVVGGPDFAQRNGSTLTTVSPDQWDAYPRGLDLTGLRP